MADKHRQRIHLAAHQKKGEVIAEAFLVGSRAGW
jgi:hypothetical protein